MRQAADPSEQPDGATGGTTGRSRRLVTVLFADVVGSTGIAELLDPEPFGTLQARMFAAVRPVIERHGGTIEKFIGDAVMAVFGVPRVREDDALRAARAALELGPAIAQLDQQIQRQLGIRLLLRVGLHSGEVVSADGADALVSGDAVNLAARLEAMAGPGEILLSAETRSLLGGSVVTRDIGPTAVRGRERQVTVHQLLELTGADPRARLDAPFVGRSDELEVLRTALDEAAGGSTRLVSLLGYAGVGKSRLARQFLTSVADRVQVLRGQCLSYGDGITWWPLGAVLREAVREDAEAAPGAVVDALERVLASSPEGASLIAVLASVLGIGDRAASADDIAWAMRRVLAVLAEHSPVCLVIEDIHWAEPPLLDLLESIIDWSPDVRLLIVCLARPDLLDVRPGWGTGRPSTRTLSIETLGDPEAAALLRAIPGGAAIPVELASRILAAAEGNALYLEEFVARLQDDGCLVELAAGWLFEGQAQVEVPATVTALVAARIDGLPPAERSVAERGSVVGRVFERSAVAALAREGERPTVGAALLGLTRRSVVRPERPGLRGDDAFRFRHILLRDAAYARMPKSERADLHQRFAKWLASVTHDAGDEIVPVVAHHLATAVELRLALDPMGDHDGRATATEAADWLQRAIDRARRVGAWTDAVHLADRLSALVRSADLDSVDALALTIGAANALTLGGDPVAAAARLEAMLADSRVQGPGQQARVLEMLAITRRYLGDEPGAFAALDTAIAALPPDARGERGRILAMRARLRLVLQDDDAGAIEDASEAVEQNGDAEDQIWFASALVTLATALGGSGDTEDWGGLFDRALDLAEHLEDPETILRAYGNRSVVLNMRGDVEQDRHWLWDGIRRADALGVARSPVALRLRHNAIADAMRTARFDDVRMLLDDIRRLGPTGEAAIQLRLDEGVLDVVTGRYQAARTHLEWARSMAQRIGTHAMVADILSWTLHLDAATGDREALARDSPRALAAAEEGSPDTMAESLWAMASDAADRAAEARSTGDQAAALDATADAQRISVRAQYAAATLASVDRWSQGLHLLIPCELVRATGEPATARWRDCVDRLEKNTSHWHAIYARYRLAEAVLHESADARIIERHLSWAEEAAGAAGANGILERLASLRAQLTNDSASSPRDVRSEPRP